MRHVFSEEPRRDRSRMHRMHNESVGIEPPRQAAGEEQVCKLAVGVGLEPRKGTGAPLKVCEIQPRRPAVGFTGDIDHARCGPLQQRWQQEPGE